MDFENDLIHGFQRSTPLRTREPNMTKPRKAQKQRQQQQHKIDSKDGLIMDTNNSSIVSKRSVEKLYYAGEPEYFRYFVSKFKRRSPLINRGYWLRMRAVDETVTRFLKEDVGGKSKVIINLGCGYDPLPWLFLGKKRDLCNDATFVDVDYPPLMRKKVKVIEETEQLRSLLPSFKKTSLVTLGDTLLDNGLLADSENYLPIGCDLRNLDTLSRILEDRLKLIQGHCAVAVLFVAEVSVAYMERNASQAVLEWASQYNDVRFCLLEQHLPDGADHPFAQSMLKHFQKLRTPLNAIGTMDEMSSRFENAGWPASGIDIRSLWQVWGDEGFVSLDKKKRMDKIEPFDEWEELALFGSHYFLMVATKNDQTISFREPSGHQCNSVHIAVDTNLEAEENALFAHNLPGPQSSRRFGAILPSQMQQDASTVGLYAGLGTKERESDTVSFSAQEDALALSGPSIRSGIMCHSITRVGRTPDILLVGGRASPEKASASCWLWHNGEWTQVQDLPEGRYRHCAVHFYTSNGEPAVLIFGGKNSQGDVLDSWLMWTAQSGWVRPETEYNDPTGNPCTARFGAAAHCDVSDPSRCKGILIGGMDSNGTILGDRWSFSMGENGKLLLMKCEETIKYAKRHQITPLQRFGAQLVSWMNRDILVGGVTADSMLSRENEIVDISSGKGFPISGSRPLLIGHNAVGLDDGLLILGGGATCFSFGTYWNSSYVLTTSQEYRGTWRALPKLSDSKALPQQFTSPRFPEYDKEASGSSLPASTLIPRRHVSSRNEFEEILRAGKPVILTGRSIGACTSLWTSDYLKEKIGPERMVVVHDSPSKKMDFQTKNFSYKTQSFASFIDDIDQHASKLYLRALSSTSPSNRPTILSDDFPSIAPDFKLPDELSYVEHNTHSSPLRISGPVTMWLHYDVMANVLCQIRGRKRLILFPPSDVTRLGFKPGASSSSINLFSDNDDVDSSIRYPDLGYTHPHEAVLDPGDILFIPMLWLHTAAPTEELSVAVNVFFRNMKAAAYAAGRDVYGNRDLAAYEKGRKDVDKIVKAFDRLDGGVRRFYLERLAAEMLEKANN